MLDSAMTRSNDICTHASIMYGCCLLSTIAYIYSTSFHCIFLPRDAMLALYMCLCDACVCLSVTSRRSVSKRLNISVC